MKGYPRFMPDALWSPEREDIEDQIAYITAALDAIMELACKMAAELTEARFFTSGGTTRLMAPWIPVDQRLPAIHEDSATSREVFVTDGENICSAFLWLEYDNTTSWSYTGMGPITHWCEKINLLPKAVIEEENNEDLHV